MIWPFVLFFLIHGATCKIDVIQTPDIVVAETGSNVTLNCKFSHSDEVISRDILYWYILGPDGKERLYMHPQPDGNFLNRVALVEDGTPKNKSVQLQDIKLNDTNTYYCLMSYVKIKPERKKGPGVELFVHGPLIFGSNGSNLYCMVQVFSMLNITLTILHTGKEVQNQFTVTEDESGFHLSSQFVLNVAHSDKDEYECHLKRSSLLLTKKNLQPRNQEPPPPLILYSFILLFPFCTLLLVLMVFLIRKKQNNFYRV